MGCSRVCSQPFAQFTLGVQVSCGCNDQLAAHGGAGAEVELSSREVLRCRAVVGADGTKSRIAAALGLKRASYAGEVYFRWCPPHRCSPLLSLPVPCPPHLGCSPFSPKPCLHAQAAERTIVPTGELAHTALKALVHLIEVLCAAVGSGWELAAWPQPGSL